LETKGEEETELLLKVLRKIMDNGLKKHIQEQTMEQFNKGLVRKYFKDGKPIDVPDKAINKNDKLKNPIEVSICNPCSWKLQLAIRGNSDRGKCDCCGETAERKLFVIRTNEELKKIGGFHDI